MCCVRFRRFWSRRHLTRKDMKCRQFQAQHHTTRLLIITLLSYNRNRFEFFPCRLSLLARVCWHNKTPMGYCMRRMVRQFATIAKEYPRCCVGVDFSYKSKPFLFSFEIIFACRRYSKPTKWKKKLKHQIHVRLLNFSVISFICCSVCVIRFVSLKFSAFAVSFLV